MTPLKKASLTVIAATTLLFLAAVVGGIGENGPQNVMGFLFDIAAIVATLYACKALCACCWSGFRSHMGR